VASRHRAFVRAVDDDTYAALLAKQDGHCALCPATPKTRRLHLDHDHRTMELRGLLCHRCNRRLDTGVTVEWLHAATAYLVESPALRILP